MQYRGVLLLGTTLLSGGLAALPACTSPDPGSITFAERPGGGTSESSSTPPPPAEAGAPLGDPIFGTTLLAWESPGVAANNANADHQNTVEGKDCMVAGCHLDGNRPWLFGGTVYTTAQGGTTVARAEVRVVGPDGAEVARAYTDANGNFWVAKGNKTIPANSKVGVRAEGVVGTKTMATPLEPSHGACSSVATNCHGTAGTGRVYIQ